MGYVSEKRNCALVLTLCVSIFDASFSLGTNVKVLRSHLCILLLRNVSHLPLVASCSPLHPPPSCCSGATSPVPPALLPKTFLKYKCLVPAL